MFVYDSSMELSTWQSTSIYSISHIDTVHPEKRLDVTKWYGKISDSWQMC